MPVARPHPKRRAAQRGAIAQLGERLNGIQEVGGSIPPGSTKHFRGSARILERSRSRCHIKGLAILRLIRLAIERSMHGAGTRAAIHLSQQFA